MRLAIERNITRIRRDTDDRERAFVPHQNLTDRRAPGPVLTRDDVAHDGDLSAWANSMRGWQTSFDRRYPDGLEEPGGHRHALDDRLLDDAGRRLEPAAIERIAEQMFVESTDAFDARQPLEGGEKIFNLEPWGVFRRCGRRARARRSDVETRIFRPDSRQAADHQRAANRHRKRERDLTGNQDGHVLVSRDAWSRRLQPVRHAGCAPPIALPARESPPAQHSADAIAPKTTTRRSITGTFTSIRFGISASVVASIGYARSDPEHRTCEHDDAVFDQQHPHEFERASTESPAEIEFADAVAYAGEAETSHVQAREGQKRGGDREDGPGRRTDRTSHRETNWLQHDAIERDEWAHRPIGALTIGRESARAFAAAAARCSNSSAGRDAGSRANTRCPRHSGSPSVAGTWAEVSARSSSRRRQSGKTNSGGRIPRTSMPLPAAVGECSADYRTIAGEPRLPDTRRSAVRAGSACADQNRPAAEPVQPVGCTPMTSKNRASTCADRAAVVFADDGDDRRSTNAVTRASGNAAVHAATSAGATDAPPRRSGPPAVAAVIANNRSESGYGNAMNNTPSTIAKTVAASAMLSAMTDTAAAVYHGAPLQRPDAPAGSRAAA